MTAVLEFPGGVALIDESTIWRALEAWRLEGGRYLIEGGPHGALCRLTRGRERWLGRSKLGPADAVANALQASQSPPPLTRADD